MSTRDLFDNIAAVGSDEEDDEDFDEDTGEVRAKKTNGTNGIDDSSEEEDEDDEELLAQVRCTARHTGADVANQATGRCRIRGR